ncbi:Nitrogen fixation protein of unknown function [Synechococcus sp. MIT S9509]|uniref:Nif11-like leader peptide family natural product precursor n=1 Tax=unclassified Synechococcus TaxID=2626047 RepID=UPI0007BB97EC|nr:MULTISPECIES: Nif11-like leader peptide family natural product precursor [unclassified Synechococcus]KZR87688.1 Nitrogen fixation protein of unknown function [Synechococcus sp. MIT S9504]KZR93195.1 Nitrogen fixation protein of unknown function [Synechococcus sp. MIT S9509]
MSEEQLKAFLEKAKADTSLQEKLKAAADIDTVLAIAKEAGFSIFADDLRLSDEELEGVAVSGLSNKLTSNNFCAFAVSVPTVTNSLLIKGSHPCP